jgi:hypothetical protein
VRGGGGGRGQNLYLGIDANAHVIIHSFGRSALGRLAGWTLDGGPGWGSTESTIAMSFC